MPLESNAIVDLDSADIKRRIGAEELEEENFQIWLGGQEVK